MRPPALDDRLSRAAALFPACAYGADIGADHGRLSCYMLESGKCERMCVADISAESLKKARELLSLHHVSHRADFAVGDGLSVLNKKADAIAVLGMGGRTLRGILLSGREKLQGAQLILSAHTEMELVREALIELHYKIIAEQIALAAGRFYVVLSAAPGEERLSEKQLFLGPRLMEGRETNYLSYLQKRILRYQPMRDEQAIKELQWLKEEENRVRNCEND